MADATPTHLRGANESRNRVTSPLSPDLDAPGLGAPTSSTCSCVVRAWSSVRPATKGALETAFRPNRVPAIKSRNSWVANSTGVAHTT